MSVTTHTNVINPQVILSTLGDYEVQHSGGPGSPESRAPAPNSRDEEAETAPSNPINWPTDRRGVPAHRPINRALNLEERPGGSNGIEQTFIFFMFTGVDLTTRLNNIWRKTAGKLNSSYFRYEIGGEW